MAFVDHFLQHNHFLPDLYKSFRVPVRPPDFDWVNGYEKDFTELKIGSIVEEHPRNHYCIRFIVLPFIGVEEYYQRVEGNQRPTGE